MIKSLSKKVINEAILKEVSEALESLAFGTVTIKVNHYKIVQIEVSENKRFDDRWQHENGGGI